MLAYNGTTGSPHVISRGGWAIAARDAAARSPTAGGRSLAGNLPLYLLHSTPHVTSDKLVAGLYSLNEDANNKKNIDNANSEFYWIQLF